MTDQLPETPPEWFVRAWVTDEGLDIQPDIALERFGEVIAQDWESHQTQLEDTKDYLF